MIISKNIPARIKVARVLWVKMDFMVMSQDYRAIRNQMKNKMQSCYWCGVDIEDGEMMALAAFESAGNKVLCQECAGSMEDAE